MIRSGPVVEFVAPIDAPAAISDAVAAFQKDDPLAPVWVVAPTEASVGSLTEQLARTAGLMNVRVVTLNRLADNLVDLAAVPMRPRLRGHFSRELTRQVAMHAEAPLNQYTPDVLARNLTRAFEDLRVRSEAEIALISESGALANEIVRLYQLFRSRVAAQFTDRQDLLTIAAEVANCSTSPVVALVAEPLSYVESELFVALAHANRLQVIAIRSGNEKLDTAVNPWLWGLGVKSEAAVVGPPHAHVAYVVPDADLEVEIAISEILSAAERNIPFSRMAILFGSQMQYARIVEDQLRLAGIPMRGHVSTRLSQSAPGGFVLSLFELLEGTPTIASTSAWLLGYEVRDDVTRELAPGADWIYEARQARVKGDFASWQRRLQSRKSQPATDFADFLSRFDVWSRPQIRTWTEWAKWLQEGIENYLGSHSERMDWPPSDADAAKAIESRLRRIAELDAVSETVTQHQFMQAVREELEDDAVRAGVRKGVFVGTVGEGEGCTFEVTVLCGLAEGKFPRTTARSGLLDVLRVPDEEVVTDRDRRSYLLRLQSGGRIVLTYPMADARTQRPVHPSHVLADTTVDKTERVISFTSVMQGDQLRSTSAFDRMSAINQRVETGESVIDVFKDLDAAVFERGVLVQAQRDSDSFTEFDGHVDGAKTAALIKQTQKPTDLENYTTCAFRYFLKSILGVGATDEDEIELGIEARTRGSFLHDLLDGFVKRVSRRTSPGDPWTEDERLYLHQMADELFAAWQADGRISSGLLAKRELQAIHEHIDNIVELDELFRIRFGVVPVATEAVFQSVQLTLESGTAVNFRGRIDRIDASPDGGRVVVTDYKTGRAFDLKPDDATARGNKLQWAIYALAAQQMYPDAQIGFNYWFVTDSNSGYHRTALDFDENAQMQFREMLQGIAHGFSLGAFPAMPGDEDHVSYANCRHCDYTSLCQLDRADAWERKSSDPRIVEMLTATGGAFDE